MIRHYATLFDSAYLPQGLVLYESLKKHSSEPFTLHVLAMDKQCEEALQGLSDDISVIPVDYLVRLMGLADTQNGRTHQEWCWTLGAQWCELLLVRSQIAYEGVTYLDADMMFFSDPKAIFDEIGEASIGIIPHRLIASKKHLEKNGKFNVSWVTFSNSGTGRSCLSKWASQCRLWCYYRNEDGKFADQGYLDWWPDIYGAECHVIQNPGAGLAPWNVSQYALSAYQDSKYDPPRPTVLVRETSKTERGVGIRANAVVFYHFHEFKELPNGTLRLSGYDLREVERELIYAPYVAAYKTAKERISSSVDRHTPEHTFLSDSQC